jgi:hypothetical protein
VSEYDLNKELWLAVLHGLVIICNAIAKRYALKILRVEHNTREV